MEAVRALTVDSQSVLCFAGIAGTLVQRMSGLIVAYGIDFHRRFLVGPPRYPYLGQSSMLSCSDSPRRSATDSDSVRTSHRLLRSFSYRALVT